MMVPEKSSDNAGHSKSIHLVVVELHHHSELIRNIIQVLGMERFTMTLVTVPSVLDRIGLDLNEAADWLSVVCQKEDESIARFIERVKPVFDSADVLYFNTVRHFWAELCGIPHSCPSIIRVHNVHADLAPASHFDRPLLNFPVILSHLIRKVWIAGEWRKRERFLGRIDYFMFPNQAITDYVSGQDWVSESRILPPIMPFGFLGESGPLQRVGNQDVVTIAITGKVTNAKKDYALVFQALKQCIGRFRFPVRLVLLGKASGKQATRIVSDFQSLESDQFSLDYSSDYVSPNEFQKKVAGVDFLLAPIRVRTHFRKYREVYGKSKMSGIENDILLYRKPSLVTSHYSIRGDIDRVVEYFEPTPEALAASLTSWVNHGIYDELAPHFEVMDQYRPETVAEDFYRLCEEITVSCRVKAEH